MKKLVAAIAIVPMIAGCDIVLPSKTFSGGGITCSRGETKIEADAEAIREVRNLGGLLAPQVNLPGVTGNVSDLSVPDGLSSGEINELIAACESFLK